MNFKFLLEDVVIFRPDQNRGDNRMTLIREFVSGVFHAETLFGEVLRVRSSQLIRVFRPSDEARRVQIEARKEVKAKELELRRERIERNEDKFDGVREFRIPLTAQGLPDKRHKPKYNARNSTALKIKARVR